MKYHIHVVKNNGSSDCNSFTDYTCGGFDITPEFIILYSGDPVKDPKAKIQKLVGLKDMVYVDVDEVEEEH